MEFPAPSPIPNPTSFNSSYFFDIKDVDFDFQTASKYFLKITGGTIIGNININGTLSIDGSPIDLSLISGVVAGSLQNSKALSLDHLGKINGDLSLTGALNCSQLNTSSKLSITRNTSGQAFNSTNGSSQFVLYHENSHDAWVGTVSSNNLILQTNNSPRLIINGSTGAISGISSLSTTSLIVSGITVSSSDLDYLSSITQGTATASKALIVDSNKNIAGIGIISANGIALTPTNYTLTSPNIPGCLWRSNSGRLSAFREIDTNNWSWGYSGGGVWNDILIMSNSTYRITINGDLNYTGSLRSSGTVVLDSSRNLTVNDITSSDITATTSISSPLASIRNNSQTHDTRIEYLSLGRSSSGSDHGAFSFMNYYSSSTQGDSNYITFSPRLRTGLTTGWGMVMTQNGNFSFQNKDSNGGAGGFKIQANIVGCVDIAGGNIHSIGAGSGELRANATPAVYNAGTVSTRIGLFVENSIWCQDKLYSSSDDRLKRDIKPIELNEAKKLLNVRAISYRWKKDTEDHMPEIGCIAQELLEAGLASLVSFCPNNDKENFPEGYQLGLQYSRLPIYMIELIKDLYKQIEELKKN